MFEVIIDTWSFWCSVLLTIWLVAAYTKAELFRFEYAHKTYLFSRKLNFVTKEIDLLPINSCIQRFYRPKIPCYYDHSNDDEDSLINFAK
ncbi:hypothetical protein [Alkalihalobacillus sp. 1P02AB]|uniref:hypothetical protein n=1 Tax=Alkalihalobacillus sp. 1P02AB TaxID=3132260 RepID=UPI0039A4C3BD